MKKPKKTNYKYVLWVGACDDYYNNLQRALTHLQEWIDQGYNELALIDLSTNQIIFEN